MTLNTQRHEPSPQELHHSPRASVPPQEYSHQRHDDQRSAGSPHTHEQDAGKALQRLEMQDAVPSSPNPPSQWGLVFKSILEPCNSQPLAGRHLPRWTDQMPTVTTSDPDAAEVAWHLWVLHRQDFKEGCLTILPDERRDSILLKARNSTPVTLQWKRVTDSIEDVTADQTYVKIARLEAAWADLCNAVRQQVAAENATLWGVDAGSGQHTHQENTPVANSEPDEFDTEENRPDIVVWSSHADTHPEATCWNHLSGVWEIKPDASHDAQGALIMRLMRYQRRLLLAHPITGRMYAATLCGPLVRLYRFDPAGWSCSRAYDIRKSSDDLSVMRIIGLFAASRQGELLHQWRPPFPSFHVWSEPSRPTEKWLWQSQPTVLHVRGMISGNRTTIWHGMAKPDVSPASGYEDVLVKASYVARHLRGHEAHILRLLNGRGGAPKLVGQISAGSNDDDASGLVLDVFAVRHAVGMSVPFAIDERHLVDIFGQVTVAFMAFSEAEIHYRDPNNGNILWRGNKDKTRPLLVITDFGNARHGWRRRGDVGADTFDLAEIGKEDARSANPLFEPSTVTMIDVVARELAGTDRNKDPVEYQNLLRECVQYAHRYIDDLESVVYILVWHGCCRSSPYDTLTAEAANEIFEANGKDLRWSRSSAWRMQLEEHCSGMSEEWRQLMCELRDIICKAQAEVRAQSAEMVKDITISSAEDVRELATLLPREGKCFEDCQRAFERCHHSIQAK